MMKITNPFLVAVLGIVLAVSVGGSVIYLAKSEKLNQSNNSKTEPTLVPSQKSDLGGNRNQFLSEEDIKKISLQTLQREENVKSEELQLLSYERVEWPNSALGCPEPGNFYTQSVVPGYKVIVSVDEKEYEVHIGTPNQRGIICD